MSIVLLTSDKHTKKYLEEEIFYNISEFYYTSYVDVVISKYTKNSIIITDSLKDSKILASNGFKVLAIAKNPDFLTSQDFLKSGARGFANTRMQKVHYIDAINCIKNGGIWVLPEIVLSMIKLINVGYDYVNEGALNTLSEREKIVARHIKDGLSNAEIAELLGLSIRTIKTDCSNIYQKLGVKNRVALVMVLKNL